MAEYLIHAENWEKFEKKTKRILNKCVKLGLPFKYDILGEEYVNIAEEDDVPNLQRYIKVNVSGRAYIADYEAVAVAECTQNGNIIKRIGRDSDIEIPERFFHSGCVCEHCNKNAVRKEVIIIRNVNTNEFKQVGKACCKLYTGNLDAAMVAAMYEYFEELAQESGARFGGGERFYEVRDVICVASEIVEKFGYMPTSGEGLTTKSLLALAMHGDWFMFNKELELAKIHERIGGKDFFTDCGYEKADKVIEYYNSLKRDNDFVRNIGILLDNNYTTGRNFGFLAYLPCGYDKAMFKISEEKKRKEAAKEVSYFGEVGKRYKNLKVAEIKDIASYETMFGVVTVYKILLEDGNVLTWKTTSGLTSQKMDFIDKAVAKAVTKKYGKNAYCYCDSHRYTDCLSVEKVTFTVKEHSEYRDEKQTIVQRCAFTYKLDEDLSVRTCVNIETENDTESIKTEIILKA